MSKHVPLSVSRIKQANATGHEIWLSDDDGTRGAGRLVLRVTLAGTKRFYFRPPRAKGPDGAPIPLGVYSRTKKPNRLTLTDARSAAAMLSASSNAGPTLPLYEQLARASRSKFRESSSGDMASASEPRAALTLTPAATDATGSAPAPVDVATEHPTVAQLCKDYVQSLKDKCKVSAPAVKNMFTRFIYAAEIGNLPASAATSEQFLELLRGLIDSPRTQQKFRSYLHSAYAGAIRASTDMAVKASKAKSDVRANPITAIQYSGQKTNARKRVLTIQELRALWTRMQLSADNSASLPLRCARLALLLGGQRCEQLLRVQREQLDIEARTVLLMDNKGRRAEPRPHLLPLPAQAKAELLWLSNHSASVGCTFVFAGKSPAGAMSATEVSKLVTALCREMLVARECVAQFQFSDFRRTAETLLAAQGVPSDTRKHLQSHGLSGVQSKHYDMYEYFDEKCKALALWERFLDSLLDGTDPPRWGENLTRSKGKPLVLANGMRKGA